MEDTQEAWETCSQFSALLKVEPALPCPLGCYEAWRLRGVW